MQTEHDLLSEYRIKTRQFAITHALSKMETLKILLERRSPDAIASKSDLKILNSMVNSIQFSIDLLATGVATDEVIEYEAMDSMPVGRLDS